jgi:hypothetical protein
VADDAFTSVSVKEPEVEIYHVRFQLDPQFGNAQGDLQEVQVRVFHELL